MKILDFGVASAGLLPASAAADVAISQVLTTSGPIIGTPGYMSPERLQGATGGPAADIFSLGCVLYEMLTGSPAFTRNSPLETIAAVLAGEPLSEGDFPPELIRVVRRCLEKRPESRFQSSRDLALALKALRGGGSAAAARQPRNTTTKGVLKGATPLVLLLALALLVWGGFGRDVEQVRYTPIEGVRPGSGMMRLTGVFGVGGPSVTDLRWSVYEAKPEPDGEPKRITFGDNPDQKFTLPVGRYRILVETGQAKAEREIEVRPGMVSTTRFVIDAGMVDLTAVLAAGTPIVEMPRWEVFEAEPDPLGNFKPVTSGDASRQRFTLAAGRYRISAAKGEARAVQVVQVESGARQAKEFDLNAGIVDVRALLASNGPQVEEAYWEIYPAQPVSEGTPKRVTYGTRPRQRFTLPAGRYRVIAATGEAKASEEIEVRAGALKEIEMPLDAGVVDLSVVLGSGRPPSGFVVWSVHSADASTPPVSVSSGANPTRRYTLPAGRYVMEVRAAGAIASREIEVVPGDRREVRFVLQDR